jgi:hypothetical protein
MKFVAWAAATLLALWLVVKLALLGYHALLHLLHLALHLALAIVPFVLGAAGVCVLGALGYAVVTWWRRRRERAARRGGAGPGGGTGPLMAEPARGTPPAATGPAYQPAITGDAVAAARPVRTARWGTAADSSPCAAPVRVVPRSLSAPAGRVVPVRTAGAGQGRQTGNAGPSNAAPPGAGHAPYGGPIRSLAPSPQAESTRAARLPPVTRTAGSGAPRIPSGPPARMVPEAASPSQPRVPKQPSAAPHPGDVRRVILIERSSGIQVGRGNNQDTVYQVTLPSVALKSGNALADRLLSGDAPWARDVFGHDARPAFGVAGGGSQESSGLVAGPGGDTLVIVRNSRSVQIGDHNVQHNEFQVRVRAVTVQANRIGASSRRNALIFRLRTHPGDWAAARELASDVASAAGRELTVDLTAQVAREVRPPQLGWPGRVDGLTGRQVGDHGRARVRTKVTVSRFDVEALTRDLHHAARRWHDPAAMPRTIDPGRKIGPGRVDPGLAPPGITRHGPSAPGRGISRPGGFGF